jgi:hypothetical protein
MSICCQGCGSTSLRPSHFRTVYLRRLVVGRYPVRCRECRQRMLVWLHELVQVMQSRRAQQQAHKASRDGQGKKNDARATGSAAR